ncbi:hypothetical protein [Acidocella sp.]|uniref:hypothetical protein n=1 Tax=Acidocella sp. TaxID=50710 RepID=UPI002F3E577B
MSTASKLLPAIALVAALSPLVAHARRDLQPGPAQYYLAALPHQDAQNLSHLDPNNAGLRHPQQPDAADYGASRPAIAG